MRFEELRPGDVVAGKYRVRSVLSDNRGQLLEAFHTEFDQRVVIRVISPQLADDKEIERFRRESRVLAKLQSEHAARIIDVGTQPDGSFYLVRQYLDGEDLEAHLKARGPLPVPDAVHYVLQAAEAVAETHAHGIILRELSTSHLFLAHRLGGDRQIKIIDFGTAKLLRDEGPGDSGGEVTTTTMFGLSPYSSPELVKKARDIDHRADVWSLGAVLYELLTGRPPFSGDLAMMMLRITKEEPVPISKLRREVPPMLAKAVARALTKPVDARLGDVYQLAKALLPFAPSAGALLVDRIGKLDAARRARAPEHDAVADDEELEISQIEEVLVGAPETGGPAPDTEDEEPTRIGFTVPRAHAASHDDDEQTETITHPAARRGKPKRMDPPKRSAPRAPVEIPAPPPRRPPSRPSAKETPKAPRRATQEKTEPVGRSFMPVSPGPPRGQPVFAGAAASLGAPEPPQPTSAHDDRGQGHVAAEAYAPGGGPGWSGGDKPRRHDGGHHATTTMSPTPPELYGSELQFRGQTSGARKAVVGFVAASCVLLPALLGLIFFQDDADEAPGALATGESAPAATEPTVEDDRALATGAPAAGDPPAAPPDPGPVGDLDPPIQVEIIDDPPEPPPPKPTGTGAGVAWSPPPKPTPPPPPTSAPPPKEPATAEVGTLVAIAVGGTCAFSVNGASKGTTSTLKLPLKPGTYSVTCKPATGATKSRNVRVEGGATAMAMFKL